MSITSPFISVIIPVYNAEEYLEKCICSILSQSFTNYELLLINDGSSDRSSQILDKYASRYSHVRAYHKENGGPGSARNQGIQYASGEWIAFIDADDWVEPNYLQDLCQGILPGNKGLVMQGIIFSYPDIHKECVVEFASTRITKDSMAEAFLKKGIDRMGYPFSKLYNRTILLSRRIVFDENLHFCEDLLFLLCYISSGIDYIHFLPGSNYHRMELPSSLSHRPRSIESDIYLSTKLLQENLIIQQQYGISPPDASIINHDVIASFMGNTIYKMYLPKAQIDKKLRLSTIRVTSECFSDAITSYYYPTSYFTQISKKLLINKQFLFFDRYHRLAVYLKYKIKGLFFPSHLSHIIR